MRVPLYCDVRKCSSVRISKFRARAIRAAYFMRTSGNTKCSYYFGRLFFAHVVFPWNERSELTDTLDASTICRHKELVKIKQL